MIEQKSALGWSNNLVISNNYAEAIITLDVGPRIISYRLIDSDNVFKTYEDQMGRAGEDNFCLRGGHRLWVAPESSATYYPDNQPAFFEPDGNLCATIHAPVETSNHLSKSLRVCLDSNSSELNITHTITAHTDLPEPVAAWAITIMRAGGTASIPMESIGRHPDESTQPATPADYLPNRHIGLWRYTDLQDKRFDWQADRLLIHQRSAPATKIGFTHRKGAVSYHLEDVTFTKSVSYDPAADYPDGGCNLEVFTNGEMLELETLGPLTQLQAGDRISHQETWQLR